MQQFGGPPATADGPIIFTAVQEQLGLKLDSGKRPVDVLVIDRLEKPSGTKTHQEAHLWRKGAKLAKKNQSICLSWRALTGRFRS